MNFARNDETYTILCLGKLTIKNARSMLYLARAKWKTIGIELDVDIGTLKVIEKRCNSDPDECLPEMLDHWLKQVDPPPSWEALAGALKSAPVGEDHLAEQIRQKYCTKSDTFLPPDIQQPIRVPTVVLKYSKHLKAMYNRSPIVPGNKWPPSPSTKYINLACIDKQTVKRHEAGEFTKYTIQGNIDDICRNKIPMSMEQVACKIQREVKSITVESYPMLILVEGAPGVGKTTFAWELCRRWAWGELLQHYSLVVLLRMRDNTAREARELADLFPYPKKSMSESLVDAALEVNGEGILFLLEGLDELPEDKRSGNSSVYLKLIEGSLLPFSTVLITSRPWAVSDVHWSYSNRIDQWIEILGFTRQQIDEYLIGYSHDDLKLLNDMRRYVSLNPPIHAAMYVPLNTVIVCEIYKDRQKSDSVIPSTMTELYTAFSLTLLIRYLDVQGQRPTNVNKFNDLPSTIIDKFIALCKLANKGISNNQQLIFSNLPDDFDTLGFMQSVPELYVSSGVRVSHNFLHLNMQEFLAAYYLSLQLQHTQSNSDSVLKATGNDLVNLDLDSIPTISESDFLLVVKSHTGSTVIDFLAGITKLKNNIWSEQLPAPGNEQYTVEILMNMTSHDNTTCPPVVTVSRTRPEVETFCHIEAQCHISLEGTTSHCTWLYESQNVDMLHAYFENKTALIHITSDMTPMQCFAAGWCVGNSISEWKLYFISMQAFQLDCMEMLQAGINSSQTTSKNKHKICEILINQGIMDSDSATQEICFNFLDDYVDSVQKLIYICDFYSPNLVHYGQPFFTRLANLIKKSTHLKELKLVSLTGMICECELTLDIRSLSMLVWTILEAIPLNNSIRKLELVHIPHDITNIEVYNIMNCTLTHISIQHDFILNPLTVFPSFGSSLVCIDLTGSRFDHCDTVILILRKLIGVKHLILEECQLSDIKGIVEELKTNKSLTVLDLSGNYLWKWGQHIADLLKVNQTLQVLKLYGCGLIQNDTSTLFRIFITNQNTTLQTLHIGDNSFYPWHLEEMIRRNSSLQCVEITVTPKSVDRLSRPTKRSSDDSDLKSGILLEYFNESDTLDSVCQMIVAAMNKNTTLKHLVVHTLLPETELWSNLRQCHNYFKVRHRIQVVQSHVNRVKVYSYTK